MIFIDTKKLIEVIDEITNRILCYDLLWLIKEFTISEYAQKLLSAINSNDELEFSIPLSVVDFDKKDINGNGQYDDLIMCKCHFVQIYLNKKSIDDLDNGHLVINTYKNISDFYIQIKCLNCPTWQEYFIKSWKVKYNNGIEIILVIFVLGFKLIIY